MSDKEKRQKRFQQKDRNLGKWLGREQKTAKKDSRWMSEPVTEDVINKRARRQANHGKLCSCYMCGNPRRTRSNGSKLTLQEQRLQDIYNEEK